MPKLFNEIDKRNWVYQPNFVRWRHRWRGHRESLKINTEINQFFYDARRLLSRHTLVESIISEHKTFTEEGGVLSGIRYVWQSDSYLTEKDASLDGINDITSRIENLNRRLKNLESQ